MTAPVRVLANNVVSLGLSASGFELGLGRQPHLIGCDAGSADFDGLQQFAPFLGVEIDGRRSSSQAEEEE